MAPGVTGRQQAGEAGLESTRELYNAQARSCVPLPPVANENPRMSHQASVSELVEISPSARMKAAAEQFRHAQSRSIDLAADVGKRPLTGMDVDNFRARHQLMVSDMVHLLALPGSSGYNRVVRGTGTPTPLTYIREFLLRMCDRYPSPPPWIHTTMRQAFEKLYGPALAPFEGQPHAGAARVMAYARFTALLGRSSFSAYRWIEQAGRAKPEMQRALAKVLEQENPRQAAEDVARTIWAVRGVDFDQAFPLPTQTNLPTQKRRGRVPDARISRVTRFSRKAVA